MSFDADQVRKISVKRKLGGKPLYATINQEENELRDVCEIQTKPTGCIT